MDFDANPKKKVYFFSFRKFLCSVFQHPSLFPFPDASFSDDMASDGDMSRMSERSMSEPAVKRERIESSHSLQEI